MAHRWYKSRSPETDEAHWKPTTDTRCWIVEHLFDRLCHFWDLLICADNFYICKKVRWSSSGSLQHWWQCLLQVRASNKMHFCVDNGTLFPILLSTWSAVITLNHVFLDLNDVVKMCWYMSYGEDFLGFFIFSKVKSASNQKSQSFLRLYCSWNRGHNVIWGFDCIKSLDSTRLIQILSDTKFKIGGNLKTWKWDWVLRTV